MLLGFLEKFGRADRRMGAYLKEGKWEAAYQLGHALKGVSGNIGACNLLQSAGELCEALERQEKAHVQPALAAFQHQFSTVSAALRELRLEADPLASPVSQIEAVDPAAIAEMLGELLELLEKRNSRAMNTFQALKNALQGPRFQDRLNRLDSAIYHLDYKTSIAVVSLLIQEFAVFLKKE
jgi:HPt (histidine-containing phosphotransfer) domain-containing protein